MIFFNNLCEIYERNEMVSLYLKRDTEAFVCGFILAITQKELIFQNLKITGYEEAVMLIPMSQIIRYESEGLYEKKMKKLYEFQYKDKKRKTLKLEKEDLADKLLFYVMQKGEYVGIFGFEDTLYGKVLAYTPESIQLQCYSSYGGIDGMTILQRDEMEIIEMNSE